MKIKKYFIIILFFIVIFGCKDNYSSKGNSNSINNHIDYISSIRTIKPDSIMEIVVFNDSFGEKILKRIHDKDVLKEFRVACHDIISYYPNHPDVYKAWFLNIKKDINMEIICYYIKGEDSFIIGDFVKKMGTTTYFYGGFKSNNLRKWFEKYIETSGVVPKNSRENQGRL